jgi:gas vesicle protein
MKSGKLVLGVLAGVAIGAIAGILFAPGKGSDTRKKIVSKGRDYANGLQEKFDELVDSISQKYENVREEAGELITNGKGKHDGVKRETKNETS